MENKTLRERITLGILIAAFATVAYAAERGASTGKGIGRDRGEACASAKSNAKYLTPDGSTITSYNACECGSEKLYDGKEHWTCTAEAYWEKK